MTRSIGSTTPADDASDCTVPGRRRGRSTARRCSCSARGRGRSSSSSPIRRSPRALPTTATSGRIRGRASTGTLRSYLRIVYGTADGGPRRDPPPERAPPDDHRPDLPGPRPGALAVGPRDARRLDDRRRRRLARAAVAGRDARATTPRRCRSGGRSGSRPTLLPRRSRRVRGLRRRCARARAAPSGSARWRASSPTSSSIRRSARSRRCSAASRRRTLRLDPVAGGRAAPAERPRGLRPALGRVRAGGRGVAGRGLAALAAAPAGRLPPDATGARRRSPARVTASARDAEPGRAAVAADDDDARRTRPRTSIRRCPRTRSARCRSGRGSLTPASSPIATTVGAPSPTPGPSSGVCRPSVTG